eukprot:m.63852 g.63852  ORF g.63852 m.63852 type:complete len:167 (-) comp13981_c0_seq4:936-1436(-)
MADKQATKPPVAKEKDAPAIPFANDGSFLAKFKAMQQAKALSDSITKAKAEKEAKAKQPALPFANDGGFMEQFKAMKKAQATVNPPAEETTEKPTSPSSSNKQPTAKRDAIRVKPSDSSHRKRPKKAEGAVQATSDPNDPWQVYMKEVAKYEAATCKEYQQGAIVK